MKILHILDHSLPLHSGYTFRSKNIFECQRKNGWNPVVLTSPKHEQSWKGEWSDKEIIDGQIYYRTGRINLGTMPLFSELQLMRTLYRRILEVAEVEKPNLIHAHSPVLNAIPALWAGKKLGVPVVYEIRAFWEDAAVDHGTYKENSWKYRLVRAMETFACKRASHVAVLCDGIKQDLISRGIPSSKITPVPNGINPENFKPCLPDMDYQTEWNLNGKAVIGFIGSFYRYEGLDLLISAFSKVAAKKENMALLLVGGGEMEEELKQQVDELDLKNRVIMPGRVPHDRVPGVYAMLDVLVFPRYSMRLTDLVTPLKPLEAMAMGKAVVASDVGGHLELIQPEKTGLIFPAGDKVALVDTICCLFDEKELCDRVRSSGSKWVRSNHTWERTTSNYKSIYTKVLENHKN